MAVDPEVQELEVLEGDEGEPEVGRGRDVGRCILDTAIADVRRGAPVFVRADAPVAEALERMRRHDVSAVMVVEPDDGLRLTGIFTERDVVHRALAAEGWASAPVSRFMTPRPETLRPRDSVAYALEKMSVGRFRHVPLVDDAGRPAGMISIRDVADLIVELCAEEVLNLPPEPELALHRQPEGE